MIHVEPIPEERAVKVCVEFKIKRDVLENSVTDIMMRDVMEARMMRRLHKELDEMYTKVNLINYFANQWDPMKED